ncbi:MAG: ribose transport system ATP-binding protein [Mariniblastus sp.]
MSENYPPNESHLLEVRKLSKSFPGVRALHRVDLSAKRGEVLSVIGENGAGKSTLMKILAGVQSADAGEILVDGKPVVFENTRAAMNHGIVLIHQELNLCDNLNVGQNIFLGREPSKAGFVKSSEIYERSSEFLERVGLDVSPRTIVNRLTIGKQQMVEIAKALSVQARVLIMDEPTSSLSSKESESLFNLIESLRDQGVSIIYISHRLAEVKRLSNRVIVLRDGEFVGELNGAEITHDQMVSKMVGRDISQFYSRTQHLTGNTVIEVKDVTTSMWPKQKVSLNVKAGEIVGIAGLVGSGRTELLQTLFGVDRPLNGKIFINGQPVSMRTPREAIGHGIALVPEDRKQHGLQVEISVQDNIGMAGLREYAHRFGFANFKKQKSDSAEMIERLAVKTPSDRQPAKFLSGGNQQKVVLGKWLSMSPKLLLLDEPTRGIDVGAKQEIYQLIEKLASEQMAILFVSSELEEIIGIADRAYIMHEGQITGELHRDQLNEESIMRLATNSARNQPTNCVRGE